MPITIRWKYARDNGIKGAGDLVERVTRATGIKKIVKKIRRGECGGCNKRQAKLNQSIQFR